MTTAAPYVTRSDSRQACVLGAGSGSNVLLALRHGAQQVDAVELDPEVVRLFRENFHTFSGGLYGQAGVHVHVAEARTFVESAREQWDVIDISLVDSFAAAAVGLGGVSETYLLQTRHWPPICSTYAPEESWQ
jgi:spermidine synthase